MEQLVSDFTKHLKEAITIGEKIQDINPSAIENVVVTGLGGSGIGGQICTQLASDTCPVPIYVNNNYTLPGFVSSKTLVISCSYSGNTEETLEAFESAITIGAKIFCVSSGGTMLERAKELNFPYAQIPGGFPPRAALGYSLVQLLYVLKCCGFIGAGLKTELETAIELLNTEEESIKAQAKSIAEQISTKQVVIYTEAMYQGVAIRLRQQLNENAKILCWHHVLPEMNHNELVGWAGGNKNIAVLNLRNTDEHPRTAERFRISKGIIEKYTDTIIEYTAKGKSRLENSLYHIHLGDWISVYLSNILGVDNIEVKVIDHLKGELSKF